MEEEGRGGGHDNEGLDVEEVIVVGSEEDRRSANENDDHIEEIDGDERNARRNAPGESVSKNSGRVKWDGEEERARRRLPVATPEEIAALRAEPVTQTCSLPICCSNIKVFCAFLSAIFMLHGTLSKYTVDILPHIGRRFPINPLEQEFISGVEKIGFIITLLFVAFFGNRMNKVSAISSGSFLVAIGSVIMSTPHFIYGPRSDGTSSGIISDYARAGLCQDFNRNAMQCDKFILEDNMTAFSLFCVAQFIIGIGAALYATLALVYLEDNGSTKASPLMIGESHIDPVTDEKMLLTL